MAYKSGVTGALSLASWLNTSSEAIYLFFLDHALFISIAIAWLVSNQPDDGEQKNDQQSNSFCSLMLPSLGVGILLLVSHFMSLQFYEWLKYLPKNSVSDDFTDSKSTISLSVKNIENIEPTLVKLAETPSCLTLSLNPSQRIALFFSRSS